MASETRRQAVVVGEVARARAFDAELRFELSRGFFRHVLVERTRAMSGFEHAQDGFVGERAIAGGVAEGRVDVVGVVALSEQQDAPRPMGPMTRRNGADLAEEVFGVLTHLLEG